MNSNAISDAGAVALASAVSSHANFRWLGLKGNRVQDAGGQAMADALVTNPLIKHIDLNANAISVAQCFLIEKLVQPEDTGTNEGSDARNKKKRRITLEGNKPPVIGDN